MTKTESHEAYALLSRDQKGNGILGGNSRSTYATQGRTHSSFCCAISPVISSDKANINDITYKPLLQSLSSTIGAPSFMLTMAEKSGRRVTKWWEKILRY